MATGKPNWMDVTGPRSPERRIYLAVGGAVIVVGIILVIFLLTSRRGGPAVSAAAAQAATDTDLAYLVLCPRLAQEFGCDRAAEIRLAVLGREMGRGGMDPAAVGRLVRGFASQAQVAKLGAMLTGGRLKHVRATGGDEMVEFTPVGWDNWQGAQTLGQYYTADYLLSLVQGVDDVLPMLASESAFRGFAAGWLADTAKLVESDRSRVCRALAQSLKTATEGDRPAIVQALIRWAGPGESAALSELLNSADTDALRAQILARLGAVDPAAMQKLAIDLASNPQRLAAVMTQLAALHSGEGDLALDRLVHSSDDRVKLAAEAVLRTTVAQRPPDVAQPTPANPKPVRPPVVPVTRPAPVVRKPIDNAASAADALKAGDAIRRRDGLRYLAAAASLDDPKAALAAIEPLLATKDSAELREVLAAYTKWAGSDQAAKLTAMATSGQDFGTAWPTLMTGLMRLDPATARKVFEDRYDNVAFRTGTIIELKRLDPSNESAFWPLLDSQKWDVVKTTTEILGDMGTKTSIPTLQAIVAKAPKQNQVQVKRWVDGAIAKINGRGK